MWRRRTTFLRQVLVFFDVALSAAAFLAALFVRAQLARLQGSDDPIAQALMSGMRLIGGVPGAINAIDYQWLLVGLIPIWAASFYWAKTGDFRISYRGLMGRYIRAILMGLSLFILVIFLFKLEFVARSFLVIFGGVQLIALMLGRIMVLELGRAIQKRHGDGHRVLVVGSGDAGVEFVDSLRRTSPFKIKLLGFVSVPGEPGHPEARPHLGYVGSVDSLLDRVAVDEVVFAVRGKRPEMFRDAIAACEARGVDVLLPMPAQVPSKARVEVANLSGFDMPMLGMRRTPTGEARLAFKRLLDIVGGSIGLLLAAPVMIVTAFAVKFGSKGPILFRQVRAGRNGRKFEMLKFRSMVVDAEAKRAELMHLNEMGGPVFKIKKDPRITPVGAFIRKTSIDELPQLFNIFMGDMSLVGPRPPLPSEVEEYEPWQRRRLSVKPGLTGLWQVSGRNQVDFDEWMQLDLDYIDNWSLWLDIKIILKTVPVVLFHKGAS